MASGMLTILCRAKCSNLYLENHQKFCFNWRNLRPLPGEENVRKRAKFESSHLALLDKEFYFRTHTGWDFTDRKPKQFMEKSKSLRSKMSEVWPFII